MRIQRRQFGRPDHAVWPLPLVSQNTFSDASATSCSAMQANLSRCSSCMMGDLVLLLNMVAAPFARLQRFTRIRASCKVVAIVAKASQQPPRGPFGLVSRWVFRVYERPRAIPPHDGSNTTLLPLR